MWKIRGDNLYLHASVEMSQKSVTHVIADSGAFIRNAPLQSIGEHVHTIPEVVKEIKDKATLQRLQVLPYDIEYRTPTQESIQFVSNFAKKTGDYKSLSLVDIKVMALTYQLEKEYVGADHIKAIPEKKIEWNTTTKQLEKPTDIAGFYLSSSKNSSRTTSLSNSTSESSYQVLGLDEESCDTVKRNAESCDISHNIKESDNVSANSDSSQANSTESQTENKTDQVENSNANNQNDELVKKLDSMENKCQLPTEGEIIQGTMLEDDSDKDDEMSDESDEEDSAEDDDGWITPSNIKDVKKQMGEVPSVEADVIVGCLTTDFAIQNVLIQMGLNVISVDGMLIKTAKSYVLRCFACMNGFPLPLAQVQLQLREEFNKLPCQLQFTFLEDQFQPSENRVSMTVEEDGSIRYYLSRRKQITARGLKYALPLPKGGKHASNPMLCEDQPFPQQRATKKSKQKVDVFSADYVPGHSPFAITDITSRAAQLGIRSGGTGQFNKRNPNDRKKYGKKR